MPGRCRGRSRRSAGRNPSRSSKATWPNRGKGRRWTRVAAVEGGPAGYVTVVWASADPEFRSAGVPEIMDLNVLPRFRRRGLGASLMAAAEQEAWMRAPIVGLRLGLHPGYGAAQRLYVRRGYMPDGTGVVVGGEPVAEGAEVRLDDEPTLRMTKRLAP
ncbi:MAG: GNAT family N-acetyltransferase [Longimicrobiales bacterium]